MSNSVKEQQFDLYSQFSLDNRLILSDPNSFDQSPINQHVTIEGIKTTSYYNPWLEDVNLHSLHHCLREENFINNFIADGVSSLNPLITTSFPGTTYIEEIYIFPYTGDGYATNGFIQTSFNGIDWKNKDGYIGIGKTNVNNYDIVKIKEYCNYIRLMPTDFQGSKMELKLIKIFKNQQIALAPTQIGIEEKIPIIIDTKNLEENPILKIQNNIHLNISNMITSSAVLSHDYIEPPIGSPSSNYATGLHFTELKAEILTVDPIDIHTEFEFQELIEKGKSVYEKNIDSLSLTNQNNIQELTPIQIDKDAGNIAIKITGNIKIEEEKDYLFWPYCPDNMQLKIDGNIITSRYGKTLQNYSSSYPNNSITLNWTNNLNTIQSIPDNTKQDSNYCACVIPNPFVDGEFLTYWNRYYIGVVDGHSNRWYNIQIKKTKDFINYYDQISTMYTSEIRTQITWYNNDQQNPYHVYSPKIYWIKEYQKFICFISTYNNTSTTPGDLGWNISTMESIDGIIWTNPRLIVPNNGVNIHLYTDGFCFGKTNDKWFILYQKQLGAGPYYFSIERSESFDLFGDYDYWSTTEEIISHDDSVNISIHTNGASPIGLIKNPKNSTYKYTFIYKVSSGGSDNDRIIKYSVCAQTDDGLNLFEKTVLSEDNTYKNPPNLISYPFSMPTRLGDYSKISYEGKTDVSYSITSIIHSYRCDYGKYADKILSIFEFFTPPSYSEKYNFANGIGILVYDDYNDLSTAEIIGGNFNPIVWAADRQIYLNQIKKINDEYEIHAWFSYNNYYNTSPKNRYMEYMMKSKNLKDIYDQNIYLVGWLHRPINGETDPNGSYGYDSYLVRDMKIIKKSDNEYHMFYVAQRSEAEEINRVFHSFSIDGENWGWASIIINTTTHNYFENGIIGPINFIWDTDENKWVASIASYYSSTYQIVLAQCSADPHIEANWGNFTLFAAVTNMQYWDHMMFKTNEIYHLIAQGYSGSVSYPGSAVHHYSLDFVTWYGATNWPTYTNNLYIYSTSLFTSGYTSRFTIDLDEWKYLVAGYDGSLYPIKFIPQAIDITKMTKVHLVTGMHTFELIQRNEKNTTFSTEMFLECKWSEIGKNFSIISGYKKSKSACVYELLEDVISNSWITDNTKSWYTESSSANRSSIQAYPDRGIWYSEQGYLYLYDSNNKNIWMRFLIETTQTNALFRGYISCLDYKNGFLYVMLDYDVNIGGPAIYSIDFITERITQLRIFSVNTEYIYNGNILNRNARSGYISKTNGNQKYYGFITTFITSGFINYIRAENVYLYKNIGNKAFSTICTGIDSGTKGSYTCLAGDPSNEGYTYHTVGENITITFSYTQSIGKIFTYFYNADSRTFNSYVISGSNDGTNFVIIANKSGSGYVNVQKEIFSNALVYRYIRIAGTGSTIDSNTIINQMDIFETEKSVMQILLMCHKQGISYINETNHNYRHIIAKDNLGNIMECKKAMIYNDTLYAWFINPNIDYIFIKDDFGSEIDLGFDWDLTLEKYVFDLMTTSEFILRAENMIDFDLYNDGISNYIYVTNDVGIFKYKENRLEPSALNLELIQ
jgi:hypothetical protein